MYITHKEPIDIYSKRITERVYTKLCGHSPCRRAVCRNMWVDDFPMFSLLELADKYMKKIEYFDKYEPLRTPLRTMLTNYCLVLIGLAL